MFNKAILNSDTLCLLRYLYNWDSYIKYIDSAPLPESRRNKYNEIMNMWRNGELKGPEVTSELIGWLICFGENSRKEFVDWIASTG